MNEIQYDALTGVVVEKLLQMYKDAKFNLDGLCAVLDRHTLEDRESVPDLLTIKELRDGYADLVRFLENRFPGIGDKQLHSW